MVSLFFVKRTSFFSTLISLLSLLWRRGPFKTTTTGVTPTRWPVLATFSNGRSKINNNENTAYEWKHIFTLFVVDRSYHRHRNNIKWPGVCGVLQEACFPKNPCQQVRTPLFKGYNENTIIRSQIYMYKCKWL